jgi:hypothetical protein
MNGYAEIKEDDDMKKLILLLLIVPSAASATVQIPDRLIVNGRNYKLSNNPLEDYFTIHPEKRPQMVNTALWRGYVATFVIRGKTLYVSSVTIPQDMESVNGKMRRYNKSIMTRLFRTEKAVPASWKTGLLIVSTSSSIYAPVDGDYTMYEITRGKLTARRTVDAKEFRRIRNIAWDQFQKSLEYRTMLAEWTGTGGTSKADEDYRQFIRSIDNSYSPVSRANITLEAVSIHWLKKIPVQ